VPVDVSGAKVLVTGASSGIGAALAPMLAERGATVGIVARRRDRLGAVLKRCLDHHPDARMWVADLGDLDTAVGVAQEAWEAFGHLDVLVNNAAIPKRRDVRNLTPDELDHVMRVDFTSPARMAMAVLPGMLARNSGIIVNVSSLGGRLGIIHETAYCAAKFALCGWSESLALDLWKTGVDVRLVIPGPIDTEIWDLPDNEAPRYDGPLEPPEIVAEAIIDSIEGDSFEVYAPDMRSIAVFKTNDIDAFLAGAAEMGEPSGHGDRPS
jgi:short-subunit dehydrogenase